MNVRTCIAAAAAAAFLCSAGPACAAQAQTADPVETAAAPLNRIEQLTGHAWAELSKECKNALVFGIELAIDVNQNVSASLEKKAYPQGKKHARDAYRISPFERGWLKAFRGKSIEDIVGSIDGWYAAHPDRSNELVMSVIWFGLIEQGPHHNAAGAGASAR